MALQNHCHISDELEPTGEKAPTYQWKVLDRIPIPTVYASVKRAYNGKVLFSRLTDGTDPVVFTDFRLALKVTESELQVLIGLLGKRVYFCDNYHADDGDDHTNDVRLMAFGQMDNPKAINATIVYYTVDIMLTDDNTVS